MRHLCILLTVLTGLVGTVQAANIDLPWFDDTDGNPYTDGDGNVWTAAGTTSYTNYDTSTYTTLPWNSTYNNWKSGNNMQYDEAGTNVRKLRGANLGNETSVLVFAPGAAGTYSWYGDLANDSGHHMKAQIVLVDGETSTAGVLWGADIWSSGADLSEKSALQDIALATNDKLLLMSTTRVNGEWGRLVLTDAGMDYVPEPTSMSVLGAGVVFMMIRRKRRGNV